MTSPQPLLIDPESEQTCSYDQLVADLSGSSIPTSSWPLYQQVLRLLTQLFGDTHEDSTTEDNCKSRPRMAMDFAASLELAWAAAQSGKLDRWQALFQNACGHLTLATSGTTGQPHRVQHSATTLLRGIQTADKHRHDVWALAYPVENFAGVQVLFQALLNLNPLVVVAGLPPSRIHAALRQHGVTHLSCTPTCLRMLIDNHTVQPTIRAVTSGGECLDQSLQSQVQQMFPQAVLRNVYASTEAGVVLVARDDVFSVLPDLEPKIQVIDGQLWLHRSLLADFETRPTQLQHEHDFYATGDLVDVVGHRPLRLRIVGRHNEMLNVGGQKVNPRYIESVLRTLPEVVDAKVYARRNSVTGDLVCCDLVVSTTDQNTAERNLKQRLQDILQPAEIPRIVRIVERIEFKITESGKRKSPVG